MQEINSLIGGFAVALSWFNLMLMFAGIVLGVIIGVLPGLGGANGVAILLPLTFLHGAAAGRGHVGHHPALVHLLGRALRRRHHLDPLQHPGRAVVGGHDVRRLSPRAERPRRRGAHRRVHVVLRGRAGGGAAHHLPLAHRGALRVALRATGILFRIPPHVLGLRRHEQGLAFQDGRVDDGGLRARGGRASIR
jgi:hypothetical protein